MTRVVLAICGERKDGGWDVRRYAFLDVTQESERIKDNRFGLRLINRLLPSDANSTWRAGEEPAEGITRFFDVYIDITDHEKPTAKYKVDYFKYAGCPGAAIKDGMEIYGAIKKYGIRPANEYEQEKREKKKYVLAKRMAEVEAMAREPKFQPGRHYAYTVEDRFGHLEHHRITVMDVTTNTNGERVVEFLKDGQRGCNTFARARRYDNGDGEYITGYDLKVRAKDEA